MFGKFKTLNQIELQIFKEIFGTKGFYKLIKKLSSKSHSRFYLRRVLTYIEHLRFSFFLKKKEKELS
jgi:hypothetical protein